MAARYEILRELGLLPIWRLRAVSAGIAETQTVVTSYTGAAMARFEPVAPQPSREASGDRVQHIAALEWPEFAADVAACTACGLCRTRNKAVPGVGDVHAQWLFVGEAPGAEEDAKGEPFVGQAGRLLDNMLAALGMKRGENVYIANVLKCRPPGNRTPSPLEVESCRPYLDRQIALIRPTLIVALGKSAATTLLNVEATIASLRGRVHRYHGVPLIVTYHPAYLLRNLPDKAKAWEDLCLARSTVRGLQAANGSAGLQTVFNVPK
ncbi:MAG TPA: uracil-DNA glycosylase [Casimicrobiaceae bacterium]|jgi:DNA polymerase|nr:uracil-DNA glycosylase [Casimicrobiaceae bacterium]